MTTIRASEKSEYNEQKKYISNELTKNNINKNKKTHDFRHNNSDYYITNVNQTNDLNKSEGVDIVNCKYEKTEKWLNSHNLEHFKLTLRHLFNIARPYNSTYSTKSQQKYVFDFKEFTVFQLKINNLIQTLTTKIKQLLHGSRKMFGTILGHNVAVLIDTSKDNFTQRRKSIFIDHILTLLNDQLLECDKLYFSSFGSEIIELRDMLSKITPNFINEIREWLNNLEASKGCNLLGALKKVFKLGHVDTILLLLGSIPDQSMKQICDYVNQINIISNINIHAVSYELCDQATNEGLKCLSIESCGSYHCYNTLYEELIYTSSEIEILLLEIKKCSNILEKMEIMKQGRLGPVLIEISNQVLTNNSLALKKDFSLNQSLPLKIVVDTSPIESTLDWLNKYGLKANKLDLYHVLHPNSYSIHEQFVSTIGKSVKSKVHGKTMTTMDWHDGSTRNVRVDVQCLSEYQMKLGKSVRMFESRLEWLLGGSRMMFGALVEDSIVLLIDMSIGTKNCLKDLQTGLRKLLEEQLLNKRYFNIIVCCDEIVSFKPTLISPTGSCLQEAWRWFNNLECGGSRNILGGLRRIFENEEEIRHYIDVEGVYIITNGMSDQPSDLLLAYVEEKCAGKNTTINTVLIENTGECSLTASDFGRYGGVAQVSKMLKNMSQATEGRFHLYRDNGPIESDDIIKLKLEIEKAINFSNKCSILLQSVTNQSKKNNENITVEPLRDENTTDTHQVKNMLTPKSTALSQARMNLVVEKEEEDRRVPKTLAYKDGLTYKKTPNNSEDSNHANKHEKSLPKLKDIKIRCSSQEWMSRFSLTKLNLNLTKKRKTGNHVVHSIGHVGALNKVVEAKACDILPKSDVNGSWMHLLFTPNQIIGIQKKLLSLINIYLDRLQWLVSGSILTFGMILEDRVLFLIDISGSMENQLSEVKSRLKLLIWDQLHRFNIRFNMLAFANKLNWFQTSLMESSESNCRLAEHWVESLVATGTTSTIHAIEASIKSTNTDAIYLITDGKPETSTTKLLQDISNMNLHPKMSETTNVQSANVKSGSRTSGISKVGVKQGREERTEEERKTTRNKIINTVSLSSKDREANEFLYTLARQNMGRYHVVPDESKIFLYCHQLKKDPFAPLASLSMPMLDGDDLNRIGKEIEKTRINLLNCQDFYYNKTNDTLKSKLGADNHYSNSNHEYENSFINENQLNNLLMSNFEI